MWSRTATASRSDSVSDAPRSAAVAAAAALALALSAAPARSGLKLDDFRGHVALGYGQALVNDGPAYYPGGERLAAGSLSFTAGIEYPVRPTLDAGLEIGSSLLGTRLIERGSLGAELDYSVFELVALARWTPPYGPFAISAGPGVFHARADLTSSGAAVTMIASKGACSGQPL